MPQIRFDQIPSPDREQDFKTGERIVRPKQRFNTSYNPKRRPKNGGETNRNNRTGNDSRNDDN